MIVPVCTYVYLWQLCCASSLPVYTQQVCASYVRRMCVSFGCGGLPPPPPPAFPSLSLSHHASCRISPNLLLHVPFPPSYLVFLSTSSLFFVSCLLHISLLCSSYSSKSFTPSSLSLPHSNPSPSFFPHAWKHMRVCLVSLCACLCVCLLCLCVHELYVNTVS